MLRQKLRLFRTAIEILTCLALKLSEKACFDRFLQGIQDVEMITGHLYAGQLEVDIFEMKSLRVIRGQRELFNETDPDAKGFLID